jgi:hypothetical protein
MRLRSDQLFESCWRSIMCPSVQAHPCDWDPTSYLNRAGGLFCVHLLRHTSHFWYCDQTNSLNRAGGLFCVHLLRHTSRFWYCDQTNSLNRAGGLFCVHLLRNTSHFWYCNQTISLDRAGGQILYSYDGKAHTRTGQMWSWNSKLAISSAFIIHVQPPHHLSTTAT